MPVAFDDKILSATEARSRFFQVLEEVSEGQSITIHRPRQGDVTLIPRSFLAALLQDLQAATAEIEALQLMVDEKTRQAILRSEDDIKAGRTTSLEDAKRILKERRTKNG